MPTLNVTEETMDTVEEIRNTFEIAPTKRQVCRAAFEQYLEARKKKQNNEEDEQSSD